MKEMQPGDVYKRATALLQEAQSFRHSVEKGVTEATFSPKVEYPSLPIAILLATDIHYGSIGTNYDLLESHLGIVEDTPNFYMVSNGDEVDNFNAIFFSSGTFENPLPPQLQSLAIIDRLTQLDEEGKLGAISFGNHNDFMSEAGYTWLETFGRKFRAPVFTRGGILTIEHGQQDYKLGITHRYWGASKLNPTNMPKRFMEYEYPEADISFLGHYHQSEILQGDKAGREKIWNIGGTYKERDDWSRTKGISGRSGQPGHTVLLYPDEKKMVAFKHIEDAQQVMLSLIFQHERTSNT